MTERLYYTDPALLEFEAEIVETGLNDKQPFIRLNQTAFYPTSGGQLHDVGHLTIDNSKIHVVNAIESGVEILHIVESPIGKIGDKVTGAVDRTRRLRHRQQHTAQHIISHLFHELYELGTISVHLGEEYGLVEFPVKSIEKKKLKEIELRANQLVRENHPVDIMFIDESKRDSVPLRRPPKKSGKLRVINIGGFEYSACGGTHCCSTGEVQTIAIIGTQKVHGNCGVVFLAGSQLLHDVHVNRSITDKLSVYFTSGKESLVDKVTGQGDEIKKLKLDVSALQKQLLPIQAEQLMRFQKMVGNHSVVCTSTDLTDMKAVTQLARLVAQKSEGVAALYANGKLVIVSQSVPAGELAKLLVAEYGVKGGGSQTQAQVGGIDSSKLESIWESLFGAIEKM